MSDDYLWDRSGPPDPQIEALERRLAPLRLQRRAAPKAAPPRVRARAAWLALAAALLAAPLLLLNSQFGRTPAPAPQVAFVENRFVVELLEGSAAAAIFAPGSKQATETSLAPGASQIPEGAELVCEMGARVRVRVADLGDVTLEGPAHLRLERSSADLQKLFLERGIVRASISPDAKPRLFQVGTPVGTAVDMGCRYTMEVRDDGATELRVQLGRVHFEIEGSPLFLRSGASCFVRRVATKGGSIAAATTPVYEDAPDLVRKTLAAFDFAVTHEERASTLKSFLTHARFEEAVSVWHILVREPLAPLRSLAFDELARLSPPPEGVDRATCVDGSGPARDAQLEKWRLDLMGW
ncbi:MAG: FecR domain-containing protein [Planctomycetes bacterium]|nr:FecR domain-containing protein [Planctomycetota bacterium]